MHRKRFGKLHSKMITVITLKMFCCSMGGFNIICNILIFEIVRMNSYFIAEMNLGTTQKHTLSNQTQQKYTHLDTGRHQQNSLTDVHPLSPVEVHRQQRRVKSRTFWATMHLGWLLLNQREFLLSSFSGVGVWYLIEHTHVLTCILINGETGRMSPKERVIHMLPCECKQRTKINPLIIQHQYVMFCHLAC